MSAPPYSDLQVVASWHDNALAWTDAVRAQQIESRRLVTDAAIVDAVVGRAPQSLLDAGCGEGWLMRALSGRVPRCIGTDVVPALVERAAEAGGGDVHLASYEDLAAGALGLKVDVVACNFALIGDDSTRALFRAVPRLLTAGGAFIVQTLHPLTACGDQPYVDGWRAGSWSGFGPAFRNPAPWYFRTLSSWLALFQRHGLAVRELREPLHPATGKPASVIFIAEADAPNLTHT